MSETASETTTSTSPEDQTSEDQQQRAETEREQQEPDWQAEAEKWKAQSQKQEQRAKSNAEKAKGYDELRRSQMNEQEKAVDQARDETRNEVHREYGPRLVSAEFRAAAAGRLTAEQVNELTEDLDLTKYLKDDGEVDLQRVKKKIDALAPEQQERRSAPSFGGGARGTSAPSDMNQIIRQAAGRG